MYPYLCLCASTYTLYCPIHGYLCLFMYAIINTSSYMLPAVVREVRKAEEQCVITQLKKKKTEINWVCCSLCLNLTHLWTWTHSARSEGKYRLTVWKLQSKHLLPEVKEEGWVGVTFLLENGREWKCTNAHFFIAREFNVALSQGVTLTCTSHLYWRAI